MDYNSLQHPITRHQFRAACAYAHGKRHGSLTETAKLLEAPWTTFHGYASGKIPIPWSVCACLRLLVALKNLQEKREASDVKKHKIRF